MKLSTVRLGQNRTAAARLQKKHCVLLPYPDVGALIASGDDWWERAGADTGERHRLDDISYAPLIVRPGTMVAVSPNHAVRVRELGCPAPAAPEFSLRKGGHVVVGAEDDIRVLAEGQDVFWGVELGVVIGRRARDVTARTALGHVAGYTVVNDVAVRNGPQDIPSTAVATVVGPALVTTDEVPIGARGLTMNCLVDGRVRQKASTSELLFDVATVIAHVSRSVTLLPGDLITTGTPTGTGTGQEREEHPRSRTQVTSVIRGVGELRNAVIRPSPQ
ncbi:MULTISPECIES: fumarylacetoacetate hydrolase family protein [unclassified Streptomyces]|uniref:fumarylacetoacetate hydrolase family protein n=1 Tax=unclassified Streptomyces TaxID=2593676 RepID=UPI002255C60A|nr:MULTISPECIES: fumarylacetoacetate hydrolase family protein [unclassified Streptomyces]MCX5335755.1 fumarylacetoacetate hydrolase family protein [Streptomyces sp. NBC_00140]MCX5366471.1 fumarylacetoacetate hydrolase family protein [Streptomyces sp. NBC_00124]